MYQFKLADLGEGIAEVEVVEWLVREGDIVQEDQPIVEVQTDKALLEITSPKAGRVHRLCCKGGDVIPVGQVLIEIETDDAATPTRPAGKTHADPAVAVRPARESSPSPGAPGHGKQPPSMPPRPQARPAPPTPERPKLVDAVPAVRELAKQLGIDIEQIPGTGPEGRIMRRDVEAFSEAMKKGGAVRTAARPALEEPARGDEPDWTRQPLRGVRRLTAERMARSKAVIPHYTYVEEVDVTILEDRRKALTETAGQEISPLAFIAQAAVRVLPHFPQMNACLDEETGEMILKGRIHLGIAVATDDGLMVPVIRDAAGRDVMELAAMIRSLSDRARARRLDPSALRGATFTVTSLGKLGGLMATPIINYPASAILAVHAIRTLPRYVGSELEPRKIVNLSLSLDHRIVDGFEGARFTQEVRGILEAATFSEFK
jgi:pyruvate/2-oxoglutarate dehydrogenase complex dihydrolipoamide acyltransferase (E2) component